MNGVISTISTQAWRELGKLHGVGAPSSAPQSSWAWLGYRRVRAEPCGSTGRTKDCTQEGKEKRWHRSSVALPLCGRLRMVIWGKEMNFHVSKLSVSVHTYSLRNKVLEDKKAPNLKRCNICLRQWQDSLWRCRLCFRAHYWKYFQYTQILVRKTRNWKGRKDGYKRVNI